MLDLIRKIIYCVFLTSQTFVHSNQMFFYHGHDPIMVLKLNPVIGFVTNYLCLVLLNYLGGSLHSTAVIGQPLGNSFRRKKVQFCLGFSWWDPIPRCVPLTWPINNSCHDPGHNMNFPLKLHKLNQSNKQKFNQGIKPPTTLGWIYVADTRLWSFKFSNYTKDKSAQ